MKKKFRYLFQTAVTGCLLLIISFFMFSCGSAPETSGTGSAQKKSGPYYTGDGGKNIRLAVLVPTAIHLTKVDDYLPVFVQGSLTGGFNRFSAITVIDRQNMDKIITEQQLSESGNFSEADYIKIGNMTNTRYILAGSLTRTNNGYILDLGVSDAESGERKYSYPPKTCTIAEIQSGEAAAAAVEELLTQMGITLTSAGKAELYRTAGKETVDAEVAMSRGIVAQKSGTVVEALSYYYDAASFDPRLTEAASRLSSLSDQISSGNIGTDVRNDIQQRKEWLKVLQEADAFFDANPPFELVYMSRLVKGAIDYENGTVDISFKMQLRPGDGFKILRNLLDGLHATGKAEEWGFSGWPFGGGSMYYFAIAAELLDDQGKNIALSDPSFPQNRGLNLAQGEPSIEFLQIDSYFDAYTYTDADRNFSNFIWNVPKQAHAYLRAGLIMSTESIREMHFTVNANDITDKLTIQILYACTAELFDVFEPPNPVYRSQNPIRTDVEIKAPIKVLSQIQALKPVSFWFY